MQLIDEKYEVVAKLGEGGQGTVYKARHTLLDEYRALKLIADEVTGNPEFVDRFRGEAQAMAKFRHEHIVRVHDLITRDGRPYCLVLDFIDGPNLAELLKRRGALPPADALVIARQLASALEHAHSFRVWHRDVKPRNVLIQSERPWRVLLTDFGIAKSQDAGERTKTGHSLFTPRYSAPEQLGFKRRVGRDRVRVVVDQRTDIFGLGLVLYEMLEGRQFFAGLELSDVIGWVLDPQPAPIEFSAGVPPALVALLNRTLSRDPDDRAASMTEFLRDLDRCEDAIGPGEGVADSDRTVYLTGSERPKAGADSAEFSDDKLEEELQRLGRERLRRDAQRARARAELARERAEAADARSLVSERFLAGVATEEAAVSALEASRYAEACGLFDEVARVLEAAAEAAEIEAARREAERLRAEAGAASQSAGVAREAAAAAEAPRLASEEHAEAEAALTAAERHFEAEAWGEALREFRDAEQWFAVAAANATEAARDACNRARAAAEAARRAAEAAGAREFAIVLFERAVEVQAQWGQAAANGRHGDAVAGFAEVERLFAEAGGKAQLHQRASAEQGHADLADALGRAEVTLARAWAPAALATATAAADTAAAHWGAGRWREAVAASGEAQRLLAVAIAEAREISDREVEQGRREAMVALAGAEQAHVPEADLARARSLLAEADVAADAGDPSLAIDGFAGAVDQLTRVRLEAEATHRAELQRQAEANRRQKAQRAAQRPPAVDAERTQISPTIPDSETTRVTPQPGGGGAFAEDVTVAAADQTQVSDRTVAIEAPAELPDIDEAGSDDVAAEPPPPWRWVGVAVGLGAAVAAAVGWFAWPTVPDPVQLAEPASAPATVAPPVAENAAPAPSPKLSWSMLSPDAAAPLQVKEGDRLHFGALVEHADRHAGLSYAWRLDGTDRGTEASWDFVPGFADGGKRHTVEVTAIAGELRLQQRWEVEVVDVNRPPSIASARPDGSVITLEKVGRVDLSVDARDPDAEHGDRLTYRWQRDGRPVANASGAKLALSDVKPPGAAVTVTVTDAGGQRATRSWEIALAKPSEPEPRVDGPPRITGQSPAGRAVQVAEGRRLDFSVTADARGRQLAYTWFVDGKEAGQGRSWQYRAPETADRTAVRIEAEVADRTSGQSAPRVGWNVSVTSTPPRIIGASPLRNTLSLDVGDSIDFTASGVANAGDAQVEYEWRMNGAAPRRSGSGRFSLPSDLGPGRHTVEVASIDARGLRSAPHRWTVTVRSPPPPEPLPVAKVVPPPDPPARTPPPREPEREAEAPPPPPKPAPPAAAPREVAKPKPPDEDDLPEKPKRAEPKDVEVAKATPPAPKPSTEITEGEVRTWLRRYAQSWEAKSASGLRELGAVGDSVDDNTLEKKIPYRFRVSISDEHVSVDGADATLSFRRVDTTETGEKLAHPPLRFRLHKNPNGAISARAGG